jgi:hypothetical protein
VVVRENKKKPCPENEAGQDGLFLAEARAVESYSIIFQVLAPEIDTNSGVDLPVFAFGYDAEFGAVGP